MQTMSSPLRSSTLRSLTRRSLTLLPLTLLCLTLQFSSTAGADDSPSDRPIVRRQTPDGVAYGIWGKRSTKPAPTLFMLGGTIDGILGSKYFRQSGNQLAELGYLLVSVDLPCHGDQAKAGEPAGLGGWSHRIANNDDFVAESNGRLSKVLDDLIETQLSDPDRVAAGGTSRGGFLAIHFAAHDRRVKCAAAFAPATDLAVVREFQSVREHPLMAQLSLANQAEKLAGRPVWIIIGDRDERVGTHRAIELARRLSEVAQARNIASNVALHVLSEPRGHTTPGGASQLAADWIHRQLNSQPKPARSPAE